MKHRRPHAGADGASVTASWVRACHYCHTTERALRPYGPGGAPICFPCMKADPAREREAERNFAVLLVSALVASHDRAVAIGTPEGPMAVVPDDAQKKEKP